MVPSILTIICVVSILVPVGVVAYTAMSAIFNIEGYDGW